MLNLSKNSFFIQKVAASNSFFSVFASDFLVPKGSFAPHLQGCFPKASAKVMLFRELAKYFRNFFQELSLFLAFVEKNQGKSAIILSFQGLNSGF